MWVKSVNLNLIGGKRKNETLEIKIQETLIKSFKALKYSGVMIDSSLNFHQHPEYSCEKTTKVIIALARMMPNIGCRRQSRRILYYRAANAILLYTSSIREATLMLNPKKNMLTIFRRSSLKVCNGNSTISLEVSCVMAGILPLNLAAREFSRICELRRRTPGY